MFISDIPERSSQPGTFGHLAKQSVNMREQKIKGPKCGQCEEKKAMVVSWALYFSVHEYRISVFYHALVLFEQTNCIE